MTDLVKRLRRYSYQGGTGDEQGQLIGELVGDMHEAADEIERLQARVAEYESVREHAVHLLTGGGEEAVHRLRQALEATWQEDVKDD